MTRSSDAEGRTESHFGSPARVDATGRVLVADLAALRARAAGEVALIVRMQQQLGAPLRRLKRRE